MNNNKGFTLIEILATIVIIAILALIGITAYTRQLDNARQKAYDTMAQSAANAASEYAMDHLGVKKVSFTTLVNNDYLEDTIDPAENRFMCKGTVDVIQKIEEEADETQTGETKKGINSLDTFVYDVTLCCSNYTYKYHFPGGKKEKLKLTEEDEKSVCQ